MRPTVEEQLQGTCRILETVVAPCVSESYARTILDQRGLRERTRVQERPSPPKTSVIAIELNGISLEELIGLMSALQDGKHLVAMELLSNIEVIHPRSKPG